DQKGENTSTSFSYQAFLDFSAQNHSLTNIVAFADLDRLNISIDGEAELANGQIVSGSYYSGLGVNAAIGRPISEEDDKVGREPVAMISYHYWQHRFAALPSVLGKTIYLNGKPFTIIGVTAKDFVGTSEIGNAPDVIVPVAMQHLVMTGEPLLENPD